MNIGLKILILLTFSIELGAFESFPEFRFISEIENERLEGPSKIGSEYQSDILTFRKNWNREADWLSRNSAFDLSVGSLDGKRFFTDNRLKISKKLLEFLEFRFTYFDQSDFEKESKNQILELLYWLNQSWGFSLVGGVSTRKSEDDLGFALVNKSKYHEMRFFYNLPDFSRNQRNEESDFFVKNPNAFGFVLRRWNDHNWFEFALRWESLTQWRFPVEKYDYYYLDRFIQARLRHLMTSAQWLNFGFLFENRLERQSPEFGSLRVYNSVNLRKGQALIQIENKGLWNFENVIFGTEFIHRNWVLSNSTVWKEDYLPHIWIILRSPWTIRKDLIHFGTEVTLHREGSSSLFRAEGRLNMVYEFAFLESTKLDFRLSFDLDKFGTGSTWEGGNVQFVSGF